MKPLMATGWKPVGHTGWKPVLRKVHGQQGAVPFLETRELGEAGLLGEGEGGRKGPTDFLRRMGVRVDGERNAGDCGKS